VWKLTTTTLASFYYQVGLTGNRTNLNESVNSTSRTYAWQYDNLYRMTNENIGGIGGAGYAYDPVGNRTSRTSSISGLASQTPTYNTNDWLTTDQYDNNGNTTNSSGNSYQYDVLNHLTNFNSGTVLISYDGDGNRVKKTKSGTTTYYLIDDRNPSGYAQVLEEYQGSTLSRVYNYGLTLISQQISGASTNYFGYDGHGSTRFLTGLTGSITDTYVYDAYGNLINSTGSTPNNYLYCCQQWDVDLSLSYNRARYLNPNTGRFWTMDSYEGDNEDPLSLHKYLYGADNPVNEIDPSGHASLNSARLGSAIHKYIGELFMEDVPGGISGRSVATALKLPDTITALFPDLVDVTHTQVYEIKPNGIASFALGEAQLEGYIQAFNALDPLKRKWKEGTDYTPPLSFEITDPPTGLPTFVVMQRPMFGVILYSTLQQYVEKEAENVGEEEEADEGVSIGDSFLGF